jgi:hypothetical protein
MRSSKIAGGLHRLIPEGLARRYSRLLRIKMDSALTRFSHENPGSGQIWIWRGSIQDVVTHDVNLLIVLGIDQRSFALR